MLQSLTFQFVLVALLLPIVGAALLRILAPQIGQRGLWIGSLLVFGLASASAIWLARSDAGELRIGQYTLLLPPLRPAPVLSLPIIPTPLPLFSSLPATASVTALPASPSASPSLTSTLTATPEATPVPTETATVEPTVAPTPEPAVTAVPAATAVPQQTYTVQSGDTLGSIAARYGVTIEALLAANGLTPEQGDSLRVGQVLIIP